MKRFSKELDQIKIKNIMRNIIVIKYLENICKGGTALEICPGLWFQVYDGVIAKNTSCHTKQRQVLNYIKGRVRKLTSSYKQESRQLGAVSVSCCLRLNKYTHMIFI